MKIRPDRTTRQRTTEVIGPPEQETGPVFIMENEVSQEDIDWCLEYLSDFVDLDNDDKEWLEFMGTAYDLLLIRPDLRGAVPLDDAVWAACKRATEDATDFVPYLDNVACLSVMFPGRPLWERMEMRQVAEMEEEAQACADQHLYGELLSYVEPMAVIDPDRSVFRRPELDEDDAARLLEWIGRLRDNAREDSPAWRTLIAELSKLKLAFPELAEQVELTKDDWGQMIERYHQARSVGVAGDLAIIAAEKAVVTPEHELILVGGPTRGLQKLPSLPARPAVG